MPILARRRAGAPRALLRLRGLAGLALFGALAACSGGNLASQIAKPPEFAPKDQAKCGVTKSQSRPLIVEWPSGDRAALEARMKQGTVPVAYHGCEMEVLTQCRGPGSYAFTPVNPKSDKIVMKDADELYANIPVYAAKFEGKLAQSGSLNVTMTTVGRFESDRDLIGAPDLAGGDACKGATHVITAVTVGAFEFFAGASAEAGASASGFGAAAGGKSSSERETLNADGDDKVCSKVTGTDKAPPFGCGALIRLEVVPLGDKSGGAPACGPGTDWNGTQCAARVSKDCDAGLHFEAGKGCVPNVGAAAVTAKPGAPSCGDEAACTDLCKKSVGSACTELAGRIPGSAAGAAAITDLYQKGCDAGDTKGCVQLGEILFQAKYGLARDGKRAAALFQAACDKGDPNGCTDLGHCYLNGVGVAKDGNQAAAQFRKACSGAVNVGCFGLGTVLRGGHGAPRDAAGAAAAFQVVCKGGGANADAACKAAADLR